MVSSIVICRRAVHSCYYIFNGHLFWFLCYCYPPPPPPHLLLKFPETHTHIHSFLSNRCECKRAKNSIFRMRISLHLFVQHRICQRSPLYWTLSLVLYMYAKCHFVSALILDVKRRVIWKYTAGLRGTVLVKHDLFWKTSSGTEDGKRKGIIDCGISWWYVNCVWL